MKKHPIATKGTYKTKGLQWILLLRAPTKLRVYNGLGSGTKLHFHTKKQ
jgi:hypothetical protein